MEPDPRASGHGFLRFSYCLKLDPIGSSRLTVQPGAWSRGLRQPRVPGSSPALSLENTLHLPFAVLREGSPTSLLRPILSTQMTG